MMRNRFSVQLSLRLKLIVLMLSLYGVASAQEYTYKYQRELKGIADKWHKIEIPADAYSKLNRDFSDVRVIGIKANGDTIEAPYILKAYTDKYNNQRVDFKLINQSNNAKGYYYTFELPETKLVNSIELSFGKSNFDWFVTLEGSQNQQEWFTIVNKSRVVGIENSHTSYKYTRLEFKDVKYKYLRLKVPTGKNPKFKSATMEERKVHKGIYNTPEIISFKVIEKAKLNKTEVLFSLTQMLPISYLNINISDSIDYYRPISVEYAIDSIQNNQGWHYRYRHLFNGTLSSLNKEGYNFSNQVMKHIRVTIDNADNEPLHINSVKAHGNQHSLVVRFTEPATYYFVYGNSNAYVPNYDIARFEDNIPTNITFVKAGNEKTIEDIMEEEVDPLFKDDIWLWAIMIFVIFILGWFSFKMLKND